MSTLLGGKKVRAPAHCSSTDDRIQTAQQNIWFDLVQCPEEQSAFFPALDARANLGWSRGRGAGRLGVCRKLGAHRKGGLRSLPNELEMHGHILPGYTGASLEKH